MSSTSTIQICATSERRPRRPSSPRGSDRRRAFVGASSPTPRPAVDNGLVVLPALQRVAGPRRRRIALGTDRRAPSRTANRRHPASGDAPDVDRTDLDACPGLAGGWSRSSTRSESAVGRGPRGCSAVRECHRYRISQPPTEAVGRRHARERPGPHSAEPVASSRSRVTTCRTRSWIEREEAKPLKVAARVRIPMGLPPTTFVLAGRAVDDALSGDARRGRQFGGEPVLGGVGGAEASSGVRGGRQAARSLAAGEPVLGGVG